MKAKKQRKSRKRNSANNNQILRELMEEHNLTRRQVADIMKISPSAVDRWLVPPTKKGRPNPTFRQMSDSRLDHFCQSLERELETA